MATDPNPVPRRRLDVTLHVGADSIDDLAVHLLELATELLSDDGGPESVDRYSVTGGATSHLVVDVDETITPAAYELALLRWAQHVVEHHPRAEHRAGGVEWEIF